MTSVGYNLVKTLLLYYC